MRFAHLSDSHLGYRQFGLLERENDFYEVFSRTIDKIIEEDVDFVIHSGDLFDVNRPSTEALLAFQKALLRLNEANIPVYAIAGNHDSILRKNALPPLVLFKDLGLNIISPDHSVYVKNGVLICGIPYVPSSQKGALVKSLNKLSEYSNKYLKSILVLHQGIDKYLQHDAAELEIGEIPQNFDYYAMGHLHNYIENDFGKGKLVYPGSMEIWRTDENNENYREYGKGFCVVDLSHDKPIVERIKVDLPRKFFKEVIEYKDFDKKIHQLKEEIDNLKKRPMIDLSVVGGDFNSASLYESIQNTIGNNVLNLRPIFRPDDFSEDEIIIDDSKKLDSRTLLYDIVEEKYGKKESLLSIDLLDELSIGNIEEAKTIAKIYYDENYFKIEEEKEPNLDNYSSNETNLDNFSTKNESNLADNNSNLDSYANLNNIDETDNSNSNSNVNLNNENNSFNSNSDSNANSNKENKSKIMSLDDF